MKSAAGFLLEVVGGVLIVASIVAVGPAVGSVIGAEPAVKSVLEFVFLAIAGIVGFTLGLFLHKIEKLVGE
ncbi:MAG: hypothetical protein ABIG39_05170 [Candidatus Micrarchaeota archaeon]